MHTTKEILQRFEETATYYRTELEKFSLEQLQHKSSDDQWSLGQMYQHLIQAALDMQLRHAAQCLVDSQEDVENQEKTEGAKAIFAQGSFPPIRIHVPPSAAYTPAQPSSKEQLISGLNNVISSMRAIEPALAQASRQRTVAHPQFGGLCAHDWFQLVEMHYRHHLLQLERLRVDAIGQ